MKIFNKSICLHICTVYTVGWVNLYQKLEIEKYAVCGKLILPKKWKDIFLNFLAKLACKFAWICKYLQASCILLKIYSQNLIESSFT